MSIHLVIIDAMNLIRRVHAAQPNPEDIASTAQVCTRALHKIIRSSEPTHIVAVFDHTGQDRGWRAKLVPEYKQGRKPMPEVLQQGLDSIQDAFWEEGVDSLLSSGDEADDMIATLAIKVANHDGQVTIVSTDKGYCQLLQPTVRIRDYFQQRWLDSPFIEKEFAVQPEQLTDYWGLTGISSSGVSGVPGIGPKTASTLLQRYGTLEQLYAAEDIEPKWQKKLEGTQELALRCKQVATLKTDITLGFNLQDIRYSAQGA
ncbi:flap endonuclease Xni [Grimontia hollisae]|uniref:Flap endonuclease Xni n=2 Tax=Grimontia hollisae TaxID=673 RepID=D0ICP8_GRIHO|nr:flap endonuclease Xni [Grimontia hollisae]AMG30029.1 flap endonuclease Xni [Grimontia hollisae]EEY71666.1 exonuclease IX [Grimontia hollisae CIP 101886]STO42821.1 Exonuclease IX [Grimontia hollisae]STO56617.1 Exonuclease IX [Grimontia hollisae]